MTIDRDSLLGIGENRIPMAITEPGCRKSAVCIPLIPTPEGFDVLFEVRSSRIEDQPGDICFPGGMAEPGETLEETALRETCEELLVEPGQLELLFPADYLQASLITVFPFAAILNGYTGTFSSDEVEEVFTVPLSYFIENEPDAYHMEWLPNLTDDFPYDLIVGGRNYRWRRQVQDCLFYSCGGHIIWGMTAKMIKAFAELFR